jgi:DNA-binding beta-propeller fold protein YncE
MIRNLMRCVIIGALLSSAPSFGAEAVKLRFIGAFLSDEKGDAFKAPQGTACTSSVLVIADTGKGRLLKYDKKNGTLMQSGEYRVPNLTSPSRVHLNSKGEIFVLDEREHRIARLNASGEFLDHLKPTGVPAPETFVPRSFAIDARDNIYVLDVFAERVLVLDAAGKFLRAVKFPDNHGAVSDVAVDTGGAILLLDSVRCSIYSAALTAQAFSPLAENLKEYLLFPTNIMLDDTGMIYVTDQNGSSIVMLSQTGAVLGKQLGMGWKDGFVRYPSQVCITGTGELFIADRENNRVQVFTVVR